jgi:ADP-dependent NAD(P)H-hydrate dehydratase / NAD(P)H-hydrate epimerase
MKLYTAAQIQNWDAYTIQHEPIASIHLMERAATACFNWVKDFILSNNQIFPAIKNLPVKFFCGKGNNGGDGLALARILIKNEYNVSVFIIETGKMGSDDFEENLKQLSASCSAIHFIKGTGDLPLIDENDLLIDAIFGTGLNKPVTGPAQSVIESINRSEARVISIDIPSGMFADKSSKGLPVVKATHTLSFEIYKTCFLMPENAEATGQVHLLGIGLHKGFVEKENTVYELIDRPMIAGIFRPRLTFSHKGNYGHALIVAGSYGKMGAAILATRACARSGVGLVTVHVTPAGYQILQITVPEAMVITEAATGHNTFTAVGIGPGIGTMDTALEYLKNAINLVKKQNETNSGSGKCSLLVVDADALNILSMHPQLPHTLPANTILTPHPKEFERLFGKSENDFERIGLALKMAASLNCYIILKGHHSFIAAPSGRGFFNDTGNAGMATGGSGDVLTGILTGLAAQGYTPLETCLMGVYLHGLAGDMASVKFSQEAMMAGDIIESLGDAFKASRPQ